MELTWSLDYCLACDRQTSGGAYCSQSCRLADHETSNWSDQGNAASSTSTKISPPPTAKNQQGSGFYLSPAINFEMYKASSATPSSKSASKSTTGAPTAHPQGALSPSSSQSSLTSLTSDASQKCQLSEKVHNELRAYTNSFDTTRNWRRRRTWS